LRDHACDHSGSTGVSAANPSAGDDDHAVVGNESPVGNHLHDPDSARKFIEGKE